MVSFEEWVASFEAGGRFAFCSKGDKPPADRIVVWEDQWHFRQEIVRSRVLSKLGLLEKIPGRLCEIRRISRPETDFFLNENHLQGPATARVKYGLFLPERYFRVLKEKPAGAELLMAVMTFSGARSFHDGTRSYELIRFAVRCNYHVQGGFSRLLQNFIREKDPDSVMTYVDMDWYSGSTYEGLGFEPAGRLPPIRYTVDEEGTRRPAEGPQYDVINKGSIKMIWKKKFG